jgi:hypothetical protein
MRKLCIVVVGLCLILSAGPATAKTVSIGASPNPARVGERVRHDVGVGTVGRLEVWVSASGFEQPASGTLPSGTWTFECCPSQTAGTPAWHYRSSSFVAPAAYRFSALARTPGYFVSTASLAGRSSKVRIRIR